MWRDAVSEWIGVVQFNEPARVSHSKFRSGRYGSWPGFGPASECVFASIPSIRPITGLRSKRPMAFTLKCMYVRVRAPWDTYPIR